MKRKMDAEEPLLSVVARKLGQAAGTLANMTHKLAANSETTSSRTTKKTKPAKRSSAQRSRQRSAKHGQAKPKKRGAARRVASPGKVTTAGRGSMKKR